MAVVAAYPSGSAGLDHPSGRICAPRRPECCAKGTSRKNLYRSVAGAPATSALAQDASARL